MIQIYKKDGSDFVLYSKNSNKINFYIDLMRYWEKHKGK